jgi:hypothetical protein
LVILDVKFAKRYHLVQYEVFVDEGHQKNHDKKKGLLFFVSLMHAFGRVTFCSLVL